MLAYVFWHAPHPGADRPAYEDGMAGFHRALAEHPPDGYRAGFTLAVPAPPWFDPAPEVYLDVYTVDDFAALERLNAAAVSGPLQAPHDAVAGRAAAGAGGVLALVHGAPAPALHVAFLAKPAGMAHDAFRSALAAAAPDGSGIWMRQLTLGPGPEFWVLSPGRALLTWPAHQVSARIAAHA